MLTVTKNTLTSKILELEVYLYASLTQSSEQDALKAISRNIGSIKAIIKRS